MDLDQVVPGLLFHERSPLRVAERNRCYGIPRQEEAQQQIYPAQIALAQAELNRRSRLSQVVGSRWNFTDDQWANPSAPAEKAP
jgi:hypothetical protein